ncbi:MAG: amidohydrolase family protein [Gammaproteobacteria bacterium]|nr:amidohydrolase family protein [Gammaproteobacteria bacterium]
MAKTRLAVVPLIALFAAKAASGVPIATPGMPGQRPLAFEHVTVVDLEQDKRLADRTVLIRDGKIERITGPDITLPKQSLRIDATGCFLLPGLVEMHAHIPGASLDDAYRDRVLFLYLAAGVTTVRGMLGERSHLQLREESKNYHVLAPRIFTSGPSFNGRSVNSVETARQMVRDQHESGYDFVKLHPGLSVAEYDALAATARQIGISFAGHVSLDVGLDHTLTARQATIDHLDGYMQALVPPGTRYDAADNGFFGAGLAGLADHERIAQLAVATAAAGVWNVPTQTLIENMVSSTDAETLAARPEMRYMPASIVRRWQDSKSRVLSGPDYDADLARRFVDLRRQLIVALHRAGAGLLLGSDAPQVFNVPGFAIHRELRLLVEAGLSPRDALLTGTANPAKFFAASDTFGSVGVGLEADLMLLTADPTKNIDNIAKIAGVVARGRWLSKATIDRRLEALTQQ